MFLGWCKGFVGTGTVEFHRRLNILVGPNGSGKTTILRAISELQSGGALPGHFSALAEPTGSFILRASIDNEPMMPLGSLPIDSQLHVLNQGNRVSWEVDGKGNHPFQGFESSIAHRKIFSFETSRSMPGMGSAYDANVLNTGETSYHNLPARIQQLRDPDHPNHTDFLQDIQDVTGFRVVTFAGGAGIECGILPDPKNRDKRIHLGDLGDGTAQLVNFITYLRTLENCIITLDQPEADLHPAAIEKLCRLIALASEKNQVFVSTHSNIVLRELGRSMESALFSLSRDGQEGVERTHISAIEDSTEAKLSLLSSLGYQPTDLGFWQGWLFLEESSAERIINDFLIPLFVPKLAGKLRTISVNGVTNMETKFDHFHSLVLYAKLEESYSNKIWAFCDGNDDGHKVAQDLQKKYKNFPPSRFGTFAQTEFERYYPLEFQSEASEALAVADKQTRRQAKRDLLTNVVDWLTADLSRARTSLESSATEVIEILRMIEQEF